MSLRSIAESLADFFGMGKFLAAPPRNVEHHAPAGNIDHHAPVHNVDHHAPVHNIDHHAPVSNVELSAPITNAEPDLDTSNILGYHEGYNRGILERRNLTRTFEFGEPDNSHDIDGSVLIVSDFTQGLFHTRALLLIREEESSGTCIFIDRRGCIRTQSNYSREPGMWESGKILRGKYDDMLFLAQETMITRLADTSEAHGVFTVWKDIVLARASELNYVCSK